MTRNLNENEPDHVIRILRDYTNKMVTIQKDLQESYSVPNRTRNLKYILFTHQTSFKIIEKDLAELARHGSHIYEHYSLQAGTKLELRMRLDEFEAQLGVVTALFKKFDSHSSSL